MFFAPSPRRHRRLQPQISERRLMLAAGDIAAVIAAVLIALRIWTWVARYDFTIDFILSQINWFFFLSALWLLLANASDFYDLRVAASRGQTLRRLLVITAQMLIVYLLVFFFSPRDALPRLFIFYFGIASFVLIGLWRYTRPFLLGWASEPRRTLVIGTGWSAQSIIETIRDYAARDYEVRGIIGAQDEVGQQIADVPVIGAGADLMNFVTRDRISELIVTAMTGVSGELFQGIMDAYERGIAVVPMALMYERITGRVPVEHVNNDWAVVFLPVKNSDELFDLYPFFSRLFDIILSLIGLLLFLVLLPLLALAIRLDSRGGIFYAQKRVGRNGRIFTIYKLRSMVAEAESETGAVFSQRGDPRVTRVGAILRRTRLDELPQLWNVLRGDMAIVGPRPERPEHMQRLTSKIPFYRTRLVVRPGLTGWAQVKYQYGSSDEDALVKLQYDLYYIRHHSLLLDVNILLRTVGKVLTLSGV